MIKREMQEKAMQLSAKFPFVLITGPRQSGKSTLAKMTFTEYKYVSLSDLDMRSFAENDPRGFISSYPGRVIIDEVQNVPSLLSYLQTYSDERNEAGMYILTGSQNMMLMSQIDQTLAGRVGILTLLPFSHKEMRNAIIVPSSVNSEIFTGCYPRIYDKDISPIDYYPNYINTYVERDVRRLKDVGNLSQFVQFVKLCAGRIGQLLNKSSLAVECGISAPTVQAWLSVLEQSYIIYLLRPDHKNFSKRMVKSPKLYFYDTGLACALLDMTSAEQLSTHYMRGSLFENMVVNELLKSRYNQGLRNNLSFWRDSTGNEVDVIVTESAQQKAIEIKSGATFTTDYFKGLDYWAKLSQATVERKVVVYAGETSIKTSHGNVVAWNDVDL